jgi:hypothetical protein
MTFIRKAMLLALSLTASPGCDAAASDELQVVMKCSFSSESFTHTTPGEAFLYLLHDSRADAYQVVHGIARAQEDLTSAELGLRGDLPLHAARRTGTGYEWTERDAAGSEVTNWVGATDATGELFIGFGVSHLSDVAYPSCFARRLE